MNQVTRPSQRANPEQTRQVVVQPRFGVLEPGQRRTELGLEVKPACEQEDCRQDQEEDCTHVEVAVRPHPGGIPPVVDPGVSDVDRIVNSTLGEGFYRRLTELRIPNRVGDRADVERIFDPLLKVALPRYVEQAAGSPEEDDRQMTEVGSEDLLIKILFRHAVVAFKVVGCGNPVPDPPCGGILSEVLAKFGEFSCHSFLCSPRLNPVQVCEPGRMPTW